MRFNNDIIACLLMLGSTACSTQNYLARPLHAEQSVAAFRARSVTTPGLKEFLLAHGQAEWPVTSWGLSELTLLALYFSPELRVAQAEARVAMSQAAVPRSSPSAILAPRVERHSAGSRPWSVGIAVELPAGGGSRRGAAIEQAEFLTQAAELNAGVTAWRIRHELRAALLARFEAEKQSRFFADEAATQLRLMNLLERRRELGLISAHETSAVRRRILEIEQARTSADEHALDATHRLAAALGLPIAVTRDLPLSFAELEHTVTSSALPAREALLNRLDIRRLLAEFASANAAVRLEVAKQRPELTLSPGFLWDQGDSVWSLAASVLLPQDRSAQIAEANARRELAAQAFLRLQQQVIHEAESSAALLRAAQQQIDNFESALQEQQKKIARVESQFNTGYADRVELVNAQVESFAAQRALFDARVRLQKIAGVLEDSVQRPLNGFPLAPAEVFRSDLARE